MKFYKNNKEMASEETPIFLRLERRHTMMGGEPEMDKHKRTSRTHSVGSLGPTGNRAQSLDQVSKMRTPLQEDMCSTLSGTSTVVITESELSSSWLYNSLKAKINPNEESFPDTGVTSTSLENLLPEAPQQSEVKVAPVPKKSRSESSSSCCCYVAIGIIIFVASLGILAAIGGIIYLEIFTVHGNNQSFTSIPDGHGRTGNRIMVEKVRNQPGDEINFEPEEVPNMVPSKKNPLGVVLVSGKTETSSEGDTTSFQENVEENNPSMGESMNDVFSLPNQRNFFGIDDAISQTFETSNSSKSVNNDLLNIFPSFEDVSSEILPSQKLELPTPSENQLQKRLLINENSNSPLDEGSKDPKEAEENDLKEDKILNFNDTETKKPLSKESTSPDSNLNIHESLSIFRNLNDYSDGLISNDSRELIKESRTHVLSNFDSTVHVSSTLDTQNREMEVLSSTDQDDTDEISHPDDKDKNQSDRLVPMNQTSDESQAALEFFRRLGFERERILSHPAVKVEDMHRKFSLDEALKYLRSLDVNNQLPSARRKTTASQSKKQNSNRKRNVDVEAERRLYLHKLREKIYE